tara:strand:+ start:3238 stop:4629 length:1392 start_codon:yes stop_codon:yes gene_type:complete
MIPLTHCKNQKIFVLGLGLSGDSAIRALEAGGADVSAWDDNDRVRKNYFRQGKNIINPEEISVEDLDILFLSPGIDTKKSPQKKFINEFRRKKKSIICDIQLFVDEIRHRKRNDKIIMLTGTNGKSTTSMMIYHILDKLGRKVQVGGNIGTRSVLDFDLSDQDITFIIELSSYQIELSPNLKPNIGILLNISPDHLDRHGNMDNYIDIKFDIFKHQNEDDISIIGLDEDLVSFEIEKRNFESNLILYKNNLLEEMIIAELYANGEVSKYDISKFLASNKITYPSNITACVACMHAMKIEFNSYCMYFHSFRGLRHRTELINKYKNIQYINDSKATNADATKQALTSYNNIYWILGGIEKYGGISQITQYFSKIKKAYLIGESADSLSKTLLNSKIEYENCVTLRNAINRSTMDAEKSKSSVTILFSPACASFDQYKNFEERGLEFTTIVREVVRARNEIQQIN